MLQDRFRKKTKRPFGGGDSSLETVDITDQVPQIDDVLAEVEKALKMADDIDGRILSELSPRGFCVC